MLEYLLKTYERKVDINLKAIEKKGKKKHMSLTKEYNMDNKKFTLYHRLCAVFAFVVSAVTYLLTIEASASFWDCGEFIASSYKLEVGHPPGNPSCPSAIFPWKS